MHKARTAGSQTGSTVQATSVGLISQIANAVQPRLTHLLLHLSGYRDPIVPWVNYYYVHKDDKSRRNGPARAAALVRAMLYFRRMVETGVLEPEMVKTTPIDSSTYDFLFNTSRYPSKPEDHARKFDPKKNNHIVVVRKGKFYEFEVLNKQGEFMSEKDLQRCVHDSRPADDRN